MHFVRLVIANEETAVQANARIARLFDERIQKEGIALTYEAIRRLYLKDIFIEMCPPEFVANAKIQKINEVDKMAEELNINFEVHGQRNVPRPRHSNNNDLSQTRDRKQESNSYVPKQTRKYMPHSQDLLWRNTRDIIIRVSQRR